MSPRAPASDTAAVLVGFDRLDAGGTSPWVELLPDFKQANVEGFSTLIEDQAIRAIKRWRQTGITVIQQQWRQTGITSIQQGRDSNE